MKQIRSFLQSKFLFAALVILCNTGFTQSTIKGAPGSPFSNMPEIAPIGVQIGKYLDVPESAMGPAIDQTKGYRIEDLGKGLYMITDNAYQSMFMIYESGVVLIDIPRPFAKHINKAVGEITTKPITHIIYSHSHSDHIAGFKSLNLKVKPIIIAHEETKRLLLRANDPNRPIPTVTFKDKYTLKAGNQTLELSYHGVAHEPGNIFIYAPAQQTLMVVDVIFPGWMPWRRFALAQDVPGYFLQVEEIHQLKWKTLVSGHVTRTGTHADVALQLEFMNDLKMAAQVALATTKGRDGIDPVDKGNPWVNFDNYIDKVVIQCMNTLVAKMVQDRLAGYDVSIRINAMPWSKPAD